MNMHQFYYKQSGIALIVFLTIFLLSATAILLYRFNNRTDFVLENQVQTARALAQAKEALIGFAATYAETHPGQPQGYLPCPDYDGDGSANPPCGTKGYSVIGRFPWRTLGLPPLRDGSAECLWYAVSGRYKDNPKKTLTSDTNGLFIVKNADDVTIANTEDANQAIAIIFAPGRAIQGQNRTTTGNTLCGDNAQPINYLDHLEFDQNGDVVIDYAIENFSGHKTNETSGNPGGDNLPTATPSIFVKAPLIREDSNIANVIFNDTLMLITPKDFEAVYERMNYWVAREVKRCLEEYANSNTDNKYPWASKLDSYDYIDDKNERFGRIPDTLSKTHDNNSNMPINWTADPNASSLSSPPCGVPICFDENQSTDSSKCGNPPGIKDKNWYWWWWDEWKEMVFFAVDKKRCPTCSLSDPSTLTLSGTSMDMLVLVAGRKLDNQTRNDKTLINEYLEEGNIDGNENFIQQWATDNFNDAVCGNSDCEL